MAGKSLHGRGDVLMIYLFIYLCDFWLVRLEYKRGFSASGLCILEVILHGMCQALFYSGGWYDTKQ